MRKTIYLLLAFLCLMTSCSKEKNKFILKGEISGLSSDTLLVYYQVPEFQLDTIFCKNGIFEYTIQPDTFTLISLIFSAEESLPILAEKGQKVQIKGSVTEPQIEGKGENQLMNEILSLLREVPEKEKKQMVDSLIQANPQSYSNIYLIDKYYVRDSKPDYKHLQNLIKGLSGIIKDTPYMLLLQGQINNLATTKSSSIHLISGHDRKSEAFKWSTIKDKYILIDFWASWHPQSITEQDSLQFVIKALEKENFIGKEALAAQKAEGLKRKIVGIELYDKAIPRHGYDVEVNGEVVGTVTTGYNSISTGKSVCMALVNIEHTKLDTEVAVRIRKKVFPGKVTKKRFYDKNYKK